LLLKVSETWKECRRASNYDLVFVQREAFMLGTAYFEKTIAKKTRLILTLMTPSGYKMYRMPTSASIF